MMRSPSSYLALTLLAAVPSSTASPLNVPQRAEGEPTPTVSSLNAMEIFQHLLSVVDPTSLHEALHAWHPKYTDGAFASDMSAAEAIHKESPALATAILELARRQDGSSPPNSTSAVATPTLPVTTRIETVTPTPTDVVIVSTSTAQAPVITTPSSVRPSSIAQSPTAVSTISPSVAVVTSTTTVASSSAVITSVSAAQTTSPGLQSSVAGDLDSSTSVFMTTFTPPGGGAPTTITSLAIVGVSGRPGQQVASSIASAPAPSGTLRNAASSSHGSSGMSLLTAGLSLLLGGAHFGGLL